MDVPRGSAPTADELQELAQLGWDGLALFAADGRCLFATANFSSVAGRPPPERVDEGVLAWIRSDDRALVRELVANCTGATGAASGVVHVVSTTGAEVPVELVAKRIVGAPGEPVYGVAVSAPTPLPTDEVQRRLAAIVRSSDDAIISKLLDGTITSWNDSAERLYGYGTAEAVGRNIMILAPPDRPDEIPAIMAKIARGEAVRHLETQRRRKDGSLVEVSLSVSPIRDASGAPVGASVISRDLTPQRAAERALAKSEAQLRQAQKMEAIGRLAGGVAHDFNNLLSVILTCGSFLREDLPANHANRSDVDDLLEAGEKAASLTRQLLAVSRQQVMQRRVVDLNDVVRGIQNMLRRVIGEDIDLALRLSDRIGKVLADPGQIEQVILNLAVNARDAMPHGGKLTIETRDIELDAGYVAEHLGAQAGPHVALSVSDSGEGMSQETMGRIFDPFFTTKGPSKGTGLGLSTVHGIVSQSGGTIWVYSEPGKGTTFKVYFPHTERGAAAERAAAQAPGSGSETILLVEDDPKVRASAKAILERNGYTVLDAADGEAAIALFAAHAEAIDLLLTDVVMPRMSGREVAEALIGRRPGLRVLFMSGYTDDAIVHHGVLEADVSFVQKPLTPTSLCDKVRATLDVAPEVKPPA